MDFEKPTTIALIGYIMPGSTNESGLVPIWDIVKDAQRVQKMQEAYDEYLKERIATMKKARKSLPMYLEDILVVRVQLHFMKGIIAGFYVNLTELTKKLCAM